MEIKYCWFNENRECGIKCNAYLSEEWMIYGVSGGGNILTNPCILFGLWGSLVNVLGKEKNYGRSNSVGKIHRPKST